MDKVKKYLLPVLTCCLTALSSLFWVALRVNYSGISKFLGADTNPSFLVMNLPVMVCVLAWVGFGLAVLGLAAWDRRRWPSLAGLAIGILATVAAVVVVLFGAKDYLRFIMVHFWKSLAAALCILAFALSLFFPVQGRKLLKTCLVAAAVLGTVVIGYRLRPCEFTYGPVVYAVEDEYQIVFSTSDSAAAWVDIGGKAYYDLFAGSMKSNDNVHKVTVPQRVLDEAGQYTICAEQMIYRGPFGGYKGRVMTREYSFRPVDTSNGLNYYAMSDVHEAVDAAVKTTAYSHDADYEMDFLVLLGDIVSMVETEADAQMANELAYQVTGGQIPVIYARGNHEIKGEYAEDFHKYVGSKDGNFYYPVTLSGEVFAVVLDLGEDHEDDWWEYYGTAKFDLYRTEQTEMLRKLLESGEYEHYRYRMALCHIPITYVEEDGLFESFRQEWTGLLNRMEIDICLSGHLHKLWPMLPGTVEPESRLTYAFDYIGDSGKSPGGYLTAHDFPAFLVGRRSLEQTGGTQKNGYTQYMCLSTRVDFETGCQTSAYVNSLPAMVTGVYPFVGDYPAATFSDIRTQIRRPE